MKQYIDKDALVEAIKKEIKDIYAGREYVGIPSWQEREIDGLEKAIEILNTLEVKEVDLELENDNNNSKITVGTKIRSKANPNVILSIISNDCHEDEFECSNGSVLSLKQIEKYYDIYVESKFKLGDVFTKKGTRDTIPIEIYEISYNAIEPIYKLKPIRLCGDNVILGEEALIELYNKIN